MERRAHSAAAARTKTSRAASAACSLLYLALAVAVIEVANPADDHPLTRVFSAISPAAAACVIAALVHARRAIVPRPADSASNG